MWNGSSPMAWTGSSIPASTRAARRTRTPEPLQLSHGHVSSENLKNNIEALWQGTVKMYNPFVAFTDEITITERLKKVMVENFGIPEEETAAAASKAWAEQLRAKDDIRGRANGCWSG